MLDDMEATDASVQIDPFGLQPGEAKLVGARIAEALGSKPKPKAAAAQAASQLKLAGSWELKIGFLNGEVTQTLVIAQSGSSLTGTHRTQFAETQIKGEVSGTRVQFQSLHPFEGTRLSYRFEGEAKGDRLAGTVTLGTSGNHAGPVNTSQFGSAPWSATRKA
jgi:hypothetical protein